jgi:hypothetical protein
VVRFCGREKSLTGGAGLDGNKIYGRRLPHCGAIEVLSLPFLLVPWVKTQSLIRARWRHGIAFLAEGTVLGNLVVGACCVFGGVLVISRWCC